MPLVGDNQDAGGIIDVVSIIEDGSNGNGNLTDRINEIKNLPENRLSLNDLITDLATSGNEKHITLASELLDLNLIEGTVSESRTLGKDCFDKISAKKDKNDENKLGKSHGIDSENEMEWTTVKSSNKRARSGSNDSANICLESPVSPNKRAKSNGNVPNMATGSKLQNKNKTPNVKSRQKSGNPENGPLNKDSVLVKISEIPDNTYFNAIKMENMLLKAFPKIKEPGIRTQYRINKRHKNKCYVTLPKDHHNENTDLIIKSQSGFEKCKIDILRNINNVPSKAFKAVAVGVHQTISDKEIIEELNKSNVEVNKVTRLKFKGTPTNKVIIEFDQEQDMKIALFNGIYFGRIRIRCETFRPKPQVSQCYQCQGFNHVAKD